MCLLLIIGNWNLELPNKLAFHLQTPIGFQVSSNLSLSSIVMPWFYRGEQVEGSKWVGNDEHLHVENVEIVEKDMCTPSNDEIDDNVDDSNEVLKDHK